MKKSECLMLVDNIVSLHCYFNSDAKKCAKWLSVYNKALECRPIDLIKSGNNKKVWKFLKDREEGKL